ncbi:hypothetical protein [Yersinia enterocolitica]|uniref:hypothetical protein n=1 Tax=Yersinia enterocolitica TaxID=630 RepID=UPI001C611200|nr:hypothetical protein [Yersinia enterocolitica]MBW5823288.1 hypothetical protein [Yersinia enterocolitica]MBW5853103.1 hypothetical protein [Yersinia enterocolitica]MBW5870495.1 hypothetical protein [Yersinia enterocolitica]MBW5879302.1 hypothetical protein [Yersinia enterocolitica]MBX9477364.1 hypothetical protein [Yersinia enterocolitica]
MKRFFAKNKYKEIDENFSDGDLIFGIAIIIKELQVHIIKNKNYQYIIQADLTNDVWSYADTKFVIKNKNIRSEGFCNYISMHSRYNVSALFISNTFKNRVNVFKKTSKCGLEYQLLILKKRVHFFIDGLDLFSVANKTEGHGRSVTASELRWLYRHRYMPDVQNNLIFWNNYKKISQDYVFSLPLWRSYNPTKNYQ